MPFASTHKKSLVQKVGHLGSPGLIPMIQAPFYSSCDAVQYKTRTKFFHRAVPELHDIKNPQNSMHPTWCLLLVLYAIFWILWKIARMSRKCQAKECSFCFSEFCGRRHRHTERWSPSMVAFLEEESGLNVGNRNMCVYEAYRSSIRNSMKASNDGEPYQLRWLKDKERLSVVYLLVAQLTSRLKGMTSLGRYVIL